MTKFFYLVGFVTLEQNKKINKKNKNKTGPFCIELRLQEIHKIPSIAPKTGLPWDGCLLSPCSWGICSQVDTLWCIAILLTLKGGLRDMFPFTVNAFHISSKGSVAQDTCFVKRPRSLELALLCS